MRSSEIFDPDTGKFTRTGYLEDSRPEAPLVAMPGGRAIFAGGIFGYGVELGPWRTAEVFKPDRFNPLVRILNVTAPARTVKFRRQFRIFVRLVNRGRAAARAVSVCVELDWTMRFNSLSCPRKTNLEPGASRWVVIKASFRIRNKAVRDNPRLPVRKKLRIFVETHGDWQYRTVVIKVRGK
jgi:hypothetical protein